MPEGEEEEQEIGNLFEKTMKGKFPNLVKEIDIQVQETQRVPSKLDPRKHTPRHIILTLPKIKDKDGRRESQKQQEKRESYLQRSSHKTIS